MGCGLLRLITTYLLAPVLSIHSAIRYIHLITSTKIFPPLSLLLYSTARLYSLASQPQDIALLGEPIAKKQLCTWLTTTQETDRKTVKQWRQTVWFELNLQLNNPTPKLML